MDNDGEGKALKRYAMKALAGAALAMVALHASAAEQSVQVAVTWALTIEADGSVSQLDAQGKVAASIREPVEKAIRAWHFSPAKVEGKAAKTQTWLATTLQLDPLAEETYRISVVKASTGAYLGNGSAPRFPRDAVRRRDQGLYVLKIDVEPAGKSHVEVVSRGGPQPSASLEKLARETIEKWPVQLEQVNGQPVRATMYTSLCFTVSDHFTSRSPAWCDWQVPGGTTVLGQGEAVTLNSVAKLESDVTGHAL
jgi:hypothetical protein